MAITERCGSVWAAITRARIVGAFGEVSDMWLRTMNLAVRSAVCFGIFALMIAGLGGFALLQTGALNQAAERIGGQVVPSIRAIAALDKRFVSLRSEHIRLRNPIETDERKSQALKEIHSAQESIRTELSGLHPLMASDAAAAALNEVQSSVETMFKVEQDYLDKLMRLGDEHLEVVDAREALRAASSKLSEDFAALVALNENIAANTSVQAREIYGETVSLVSAAIGAALVAVVLLAWLYTRSLLVPLSDALRIAQRIAANDLSETINIKGGDEPAKLVAALASMQLSLRDALRQIGESAAQLAVTAEELNAVTSDASQGLLRQNDEIEMAATAVTQMSAAVDEVALNAVSASQAAAQSSAAASDGRSQVNATVTAVDSMVTSAQSTSADVERLAAQASDIGKVLDVIRAIAEQTNLLALNAAIEAARAGEAGRGFAVVADEVRALAHRTQQSTRDIEHMVGSIRAGTDQAILSMEQMTSQARSTLHLAHSAGAALAEITEAIAQINERNLLIATATEQQAQVAREVDRSLVSIRDLSYQTASGSQQTATASGELSQLSVGLDGLVRRFKL